MILGDAVCTGALGPGPGIQSIPGRWKLTAVRVSDSQLCLLNGLTLTHSLKIPEFNHHAQHKNKRGGYGGENTDGNVWDHRPQLDVGSVFISPAEQSGLWH